MGGLKNAEHPTYAEMVKAAILALKERSGSSRPAIFKVRLSGADTAQRPRRGAARAARRPPAPRGAEGRGAPRGA